MAFAVWDACAQRRYLSPSDISATIDDQLQPGASRIEIQTFLRAHGWKYSEFDGGESGYLLDSGIRAGQTVIGVSLGRSVDGPVVDGDIFVCFVLDRDGLLERYSIREVYT